MLYDCMIIGGGIAGLQAAIQLGRYQYKVLVVDSNSGRSNLCHCYRNLLGWPEGVSGATLRQLGKQQAEELGVTFVEDTVEKVRKWCGEFQATTKKKNVHQAKRLLFATGVKDNIPPLPELYPCLGVTIFVCPDCDGYEIRNKPTIIIGSGNVGANMAITLTFWSKELLYVNHGLESVDEALLLQLEEKNILHYQQQIQAVHAEGSKLCGLTLGDGEKIAASYAFLAFGGNKVNTQLVEQIGVELLENKHIKVNSRTKMTNVENVWAAGDIVAHSEQVAIAMGDGLQAAIWMHKSLENERQ
ncbi:NAD(P)/FAD-dependent oxidoreductase [Sutcliffiella deserti]|uniref:NAD(P)/FAD-dependent oxidoreductase n=1 Tax=Sutcliffiella deserti TaxID=2875501 RepID=UPI001CC08472|nr:NAD(P)/FAD-dependent oxidoreductase [Sutcliffiella deserti]